MGSKGRREYFCGQFNERYRKAGRKTQKVILSEFCSNTGYHRKYAIRLLNGPPPEKQRTPRQQRRRLTYHQETLAVLMAVWEAAGDPWSVRRKVLLPQSIRKRFRLRPKIEKQSPINISYVQLNAISLLVMPIRVLFLLMSSVAGFRDEAYLLS